MWRWLIGVGLIVLLGCAQSYAGTLRLAGTQWCPYTCKYPSLPGYVTEYITALLNEQGVQVTVTLMDWRQAEQGVRRGDYDGLITVIAGEVPDMLTTDVAVDRFATCFFTRADNPWRFAGHASLQAQRLGVIDGYGYGEPLDRWLRHASPQQLVAAGGERALERLWQWLRRGNITVLAEDAYVFAHFIHRRHHDSSGVVAAGCQADTPLYLALHPRYPEAEAVLRQLNLQLSQADSLSLRQAIKKRYGLLEHFVHEKVQQ